jgi:hypothetical protein
MSAPPIDNAILAHRSWVERFRSALEGTTNEVFDLSKARDDTACELGCWLSTAESRSVLGEDSHQRILSMHSIFHEIAGDIAMRLNEGQRDQNLNELLTQFNHFSRQLVQLMMLAKERTRSNS